MADPRIGSWQEREIDALRAREADYRERLAQHMVLAERLHGYAESLQRALRNSPPSRLHLSATMLEVAKLSSIALECERTSIWLFDAESKTLRCSIQLIGHVEQSGLDAEALTIECASCPAYVAALAETYALAVEEVYADSRTIELSTYLRDRRIGALLDIPIATPGALLGVVCHEHVGGSRVWRREEIEFAANVGSLVALALETERRLIAEYTARGSEARYRNLVESLPVTVYAFDLHSGKLDYLSPRAFELGGWSADQWLIAGAERWIERIHPEDQPAVRARFEPGAVKGFPPELTYRVNLPDGQMRWVRDTCSLVRDQVGHTLALQGVLCDVTRQVEAELERRELERRHRYMLDNADLHAVMLDCEGIVTFVNDYLCRMTGFERHEIVGRNWFEFTTPEAERTTLQQRYREGLKLGFFEPRMEAPLRTAASGRRHVLWTTTLLRRTDGAIQGVSGLGVDLTQRLQLEAELQQQTKVDSLGRLAAGVAHDFNNLLTVMMHEAERLGTFVNGIAHERASALTVERASAPSSSNASNAQARGAHSALCDALNQASELTHSLLVYGRKEPVRKESVVIDELVQESLRLAASVAGAELETTASLRSERARVLLDRAQLRQVILNLVGNAADATRGVGGHVQICTHLELVDASVARRHGNAQGGEFVVLTVADDGRGMDERTLARIFDPFFTTKDSGKGTGLGLAMCQSIVDRAGGFIEVESEQGKGTRFRIYLPTAAGRSSSVPAAVSGVVAAGAVRSHGETRILVVDDVPAIRTMLVTSLRDVGYRVHDAATVHAATQILATQPVDMLVTDGNLPDGSGVVLARSARMVQPTLKVVLVSGSLEAEDGFDAVLLKPFEIEQFLRAVAEVLADQADRTGAVFG